MITESPAVERLIEAFRRLPGVGKRSAERFALHLLCAPEADAAALSEAVQEARARIGLCAICCNLTEGDPCAVCADERRDHGLVCVVEQPAGAIAIEQSGAYRGVYHVLHGVLNPLEGVGPRELRFAELIKRLDAGHVNELIVATNATAEGEATALYLSHEAAARGVATTRIAHGVPMGGGLEYADQATLHHALEGRRALDAG